MEFNNNQPIYLQIVENLKNQIITSQLLPGAKLPSVRELAESLAVTPNTVMRAYKDLEIGGLIVTQRTTGSFITTDLEKLQSLKQNEIKTELEMFLVKMQRLGLEGDALIAQLKHHQNGED